MLGFVNDDTPLGSLANHILEDTHFPREEKNNKEIHVRDDSLSRSQLNESTNRAISLYKLIE